jgi:hypothetical protein
MGNMTFEEVLKQVHYHSDQANNLEADQAQTLSEADQSKTDLPHDLEWKILSSLFKNNFEHIENKGIQNHFNYKRTYQKFHRIVPQKERTLTYNQQKALEWFNSSGEILKSDFTLSELKSKFRALAKTLHPDYGGDSTNFIKLEQCYKELKKCFL